MPPMPSRLPRLNPHSSGALSMEVGAVGPGSRPVRRPSAGRPDSAKTIDAIIDLRLASHTGRCVCPTQFTFRFPAGAAIPALLTVNGTPGPMRQVAGLASYACLAFGHFARNGDGNQAAPQNDTNHRYCAFGQHCFGPPKFAALGSGLIA